MKNKECSQQMIMWNPWHGCHKCSEGCYRCYMYEQDKNFGIDSRKVKINKSGFRLPVQKIRNKDINKRSEKYELEYKVQSGSMIMTCMTSDFFLEEADIWRVEAWEYIHERSDCLFQIITKRPERVEQCLPNNWYFGDKNGWNNVLINVTAENENRAWERIPILLDLPIRHKGVVIAPMLEQMDIRPFLSSGEIEHVSVGGETYMGFDGLARELKLEWVKDIMEQCKEYDVSFTFHQTGTRLRLLDGRIIHVNSRDERGLAKFYNYDLHLSDLDWKTVVKELELQSSAEKAYKIYQQITLEDLGMI